MKEEEKEELNGKELEDAFTLGSMYDNNCIQVRTKDGQSFLIKAEELLKIMKRRKFDIKKARKHSYLTLKKRNNK